MQLKHTRRYVPLKQKVVAIGGLYSLSKEVPSHPPPAGPGCAVVSRADVIPAFAAVSLASQTVHRDATAGPDVS